MHSVSASCQPLQAPNVLRGIGRRDAIGERAPVRFCRRFTESAGLREVRHPRVAVLRKDSIYARLTLLRDFRCAMA
jgi:hypothetical protein